jgi:hypothetical protein
VIPGAGGLRLDVQLLQPRHEGAGQQRRVEAVHDPGRAACPGGLLHPRLELDLRAGASVSEAQQVVQLLLLHLVVGGRVGGDHRLHGRLEEAEVVVVVTARESGAEEERGAPGQPQRRWQGPRRRRRRREGQRRRVRREGGPVPPAAAAPGGALVLAAAPADGDVAERASARPVALARLAEVSRLRQRVVVVVAELGVGRVAARAPQRLRARVGDRAACPDRGPCHSSRRPRRRRPLHGCRTPRASHLSNLSIASQDGGSVDDVRQLIELKAAARELDRPVELASGGRSARGRGKAGGEMGIGMEWNEASEALGQEEWVGFSGEGSLTRARKQSGARSIILSAADGDAMLRYAPEIRTATTWLLLAPSPSATKTDRVKGPHAV